MRYRVELIGVSKTGEETPLFHLVVYAHDGNDAIMDAKKEYAEKHPESPLPPEGSYWIAYAIQEQDCWG